jgi:hypothetical protein
MSELIAAGFEVEMSATIGPATMRFTKFTVLSSARPNLSAPNEIQPDPLPAVHFVTLGCAS